MIEESETFCILPWLHVATTSFGSYRVCCNSTPGKNQILKPNGESFKIDADPVETVWNSEHYRNLRRQFIDNQKPDICVRCFREEDSGVTSARQSFNQQFKKYLPDVLQRSTPDGHAEFMIKYLDIRLGNVCNLKCRMCNPWSSNQWVKEWNEISDEKDRIENISWLLDVSWPENPAVWQHLMSVIPAIDEIYLTGGEPLLIKEQFRFLRGLIENGRADSIVIKYNSNMTVIPDEALEIWPKFKMVKFNASIDGIEQADEVIRYPSKWHKIRENFDFIYRLGKKHPNIVVNVHCTVQVMNVMYLVPLLDWLETYSLIPYMNVLNHPENLNIRILPNLLKQRMRDELTDWIAAHPHRRAGYEQGIQKIIKYMMAEDWQHLIPSFSSWTKAVDAQRGHDTFTLLPRLREIDENIDIG